MKGIFKLILVVHDAHCKEEVLNLGTNKRRSKGESMKVLLRRNRPSTKQWTSANFDRMPGDEAVLRILRGCIQRHEGTRSHGKAAVWI